MERMLYADRQIIERSVYVLMDSVVTPNAVAVLTNVPSTKTANLIRDVITVELAETLV